MQRGKLARKAAAGGGGEQVAAGGEAGEAAAGEEGEKAASVEDVKIAVAPLKKGWGALKQVVVEVKKIRLVVSCNAVTLQRSTLYAVSSEVVSCEL